MIFIFLHKFTVLIEDIYTESITREFKIVEKDCRSLDPVLILNVVEIYDI